MNPIIMINVANWHAEQASLAYIKDDFEDYCRHILICDEIRRMHVLRGANSSASQTKGNYQ